MGSDLTLNNVRADEIYDFYGQCESSAIIVGDASDQNLTINDSTFNLSWNDGVVQGLPDFQQFWNNSYISGLASTGTLTISNSQFRNLSIPAVHWDGTANI